MSHEKSKPLNLTLHGHPYENIHLQWARYANNRPALQLLTEHGEPILKASVNMPDIALTAGDLMFVKDYSENEGILVWLIENNIIIDTGKVLKSGYVYINLCKIHPDYLVDARAVLGETA